MSAESQLVSQSNTDLQTLLHLSVRVFLRERDVRRGQRSKTDQERHTDAVQ